MRILLATAFALPALLKACGDRSELHPPSAHSSRSVVLTQSDYDHIGGKTVPVQEASYQAEIRGYGVVLSAATLAQMDANIGSAAAAVVQSDAALLHAKALYRASSVSLEGLQSAERTATANQVQLALADRQEAALYGENAPWRVQTRDEGIVSRVTAGSAVIVQATFPLDVHFSSAAPTFTLTRLNEEEESPGAATSSVTWRAPADPTIPGISFYGLVDGSDLAQGEHVLVYSPIGDRTNGVIIPAAAIVITGLKAWCYVLEAPLLFKRIEVDLSRPLKGGYFVSSGVRPGQPVLIKGTGLMLARELGSGAGYAPD